MDLLIASVLTVAIAPNSSQPSNSPNQLETVTVESVESATGESAAEITPSETTAQFSEPTSNPTQVTCPAGQFASAFSDVYPTDWAYQAVNNLAGGPTQCFDLPN